MRRLSTEARLVALAALVIAAPLSAQTQSATAPRAGSTIYNFNAQANGAVMTNQYGPAMTITPGLCATTALSGYFGGDPVQAINYNWANPAGGYACAGSYAQPITFLFSQAVNSFGFMAITNGGAITFLTPGGSSTQSSTGLTEKFFGITDASGFTSVQVSVAGDGIIALDDISYDRTALRTTATPEPASVALLATGLLGVFGVARRRKAQS